MVRFMTAYLGVLALWAAGVGILGRWIGHSPVLVAALLLATGPLMSLGLPRANPGSKYGEGVPRWLGAALLFALVTFVLSLIVRPLLPD